MGLWLIKLLGYKTKKKPTEILFIRTRTRTRDGNKTKKLENDRWPVQRMEELSYGHDKNRDIQISKLFEKLKPKKS